MHVHRAAASTNCPDTRVREGRAALAWRSFSGQPENAAQTSEARGSRPQDAAARAVSVQRRCVELVAWEDRRRLFAIGCGGMTSTRSVRRQAQARVPPLRRRLGRRRLADICHRA